MCSINRLASWSSQTVNPASRMCVIHLPQQPQLALLYTVTVGAAADGAWSSAVVPRAASSTAAASNAAKTDRLAERVLRLEAEAILALIPRLDERFDQAVDRLFQCDGRVIMTGMGKSGHIARKIASTMSSTGTPAYFVHPAEASHGDLGMITETDVVIALSNSGESSELMAIVPAIKRQGAKLISMTGNPKSSLATHADVHLNSAVDKEACPMGLAPTSSTTAAVLAVMAASSAARSLKARWVKSGTSGSNGSRYFFSQVAESAPIERPWKPP